MLNLSLQPPHNLPLKGLFSRLKRLSDCCWARPLIKQGSHCSRHWPRPIQMNPSKRLFVYGFECLFFSYVPRTYKYFRRRLGITVIDNFCLPHYEEADLPTYPTNQASAR